MTTKLMGTIEQRFAYLDKIGRRCFANEGRCINAASDEFDVVEVKDGKRVPDAPVQILKTCGRHRAHVLGMERYLVLDQRKNCMSGSSEMRRMVA